MQSTAPLPSNAAASPPGTTLARPLAELEDVITRGLETFVDVGNALAEIRARRLYQETGYATFEDYCRDRWDFSRFYAHRLIAAAEVVNALPIGNTPPPVNEAQVRELAKAPEEVRGAVWQEAIETAPEGKVTAGHVQRVVTVYTTPPAAPEVLNVVETAAEAKERRRQQREEEQRKAEERAERERRHTRQVDLPTGVSVPIPASISVVWHDDGEVDEDPVGWEELEPIHRYLIAAGDAAGRLSGYKEGPDLIREVRNATQDDACAETPVLTEAEAGTVAVYVATAEACLQAAADLCRKAAASGEVAR